jgi:hypothetical protein
MDLREEQDLAYLEAAQLDFIKALSKQEQDEKEDKELQETAAREEVLRLENAAREEVLRLEKEDYEEKLRLEKANIEAVRAKRLKALASK